MLADADPASPPPERPRGRRRALLIGLASVGVAAAVVAAVLVTSRPAARPAGAAQPLAGVGDQAILVFQTMKTPSLGSRATTYYAQLIVWSGNAVLDVSFNYLPGTANAPLAEALPPRSAQVRALIAVAKNVLANLPRSART